MEIDSLKKDLARSRSNRNIQISEFKYFADDLIGDAYADILEDPVQTFNLNDQKLFSEPEDEDGTDFKKETHKIEQKYLVNPDKSPE